MITMPLPNMARNAKRFETIIRTLARYGLADWVRDWNPDFVKDYFKGVDGRPIASVDDLLSVVESKQPGDTVTVTVLRDRKPTDVSVRLQSEE